MIMFKYSTDQMQGIRQTHLSPCINPFNCVKTCIWLSVQVCSLPSAKVCKLHKPYTLHLICTVCMVVIVRMYNCMI